MVTPLGDVRLAFRTLLKDKTFSLATVATLAICVAANVALFSIVYSVLLRPLPVPQADRLVRVYNSYPRAGSPRSETGVPDYYDRVNGVPAIQTLALFTTRNRSIGESGRPERVLTMGVTPSFFDVAGVPAAFGRVFSKEEGEVGRENKAVLSYPFWQERFAGDPQVVGREFRLDGRAFTIVGVMPKEFRFIDSDVRLWIPLAFTPEQKSDDQRHNNSWESIGRLRPGATIGEAQAQVNALTAAQLERFPALKPLLVNAGFHTVVVSLQDDLVRDIRRVLYLLWGGTLFVLLIGCVNVINLALVRSRARLRELATRVALGAGRWRLAAQLLGESLLLTLVSAAIGLLLGWAALRVLGAMNLQQLPRAAEIRLDAVSVAFAAGLALVLAIAIALFPLGSALAINCSSVLHEGGRTGTGGLGARLLRRGLVVTQVAIAFILLLGAGLLVASFRQILAIDPGFDARQVMTATVTLPASRYPAADRLGLFAADAVRRLRAIPGVRQAGATSSIPFGDNQSDSVIFAEGYQMQPTESLLSPKRVSATSGYFEAMRIPLRRGRFFSDSDTADRQRVVIVDERLARKFWPGADPVGRRMYRPSVRNNQLVIDENTVWLTVVGVVGEVKQESLVAAKEPVGAYYLSYAQEPSRTLTFALHTSGDPVSTTGRLRQEIAALDPELPVFAMQTMEQRTSDSLVTRRWPMLLTAGFGLVALLLSAVGIYGVLAYLVTQRTKEIGIRMAIGGTPRSIFDLVLKEGAALIAVGFIVGGVAAIVLRRSIESQLYGVRAADPAVLALALGILGLVGIVACSIPARRATRIDPVVALNRE